MSPGIRNCRSLLLVGMLLCTTATGCGYGAASPKSYALTSAFYSVCSSKNAERLVKFKEVYAAEKNAGNVSDEEIEWLDDMVADATAGDWEKAQSKARRFMEAQVKPVR